MVIPSYWARESRIGWQDGDSIYDHPTPLDEEGTLTRALQSVSILRDLDFQVIILAVATATNIELQVEKKVANIIKTALPAAEPKISLFGPSQLKQIHKLLIDKGKEEYIHLLSLQGYSNVRNLCIFIPKILGSEVAVLIDDDEVFEDPEFMLKAKEFIGRTIDGRIVNAVAGYYLQSDGDYHIKKAFQPWMKHWDQYSKMNEAFDKVIGTEPRLKETSFVFGGNMIIHRNLFSVVPFDPGVTRGEDIDFLINARMFGFTFFLDNHLSIKHLPKLNSHPLWMQIRQGIYRFIYERAKIENQKEVKRMQKVYLRDFDPYPGYFLKEDLDEKIKETCKLLSEKYRAQDDIHGSKEALNNIKLAETDAVPKYDPFQRLCDLQKQWKELNEYTNNREINLEIRQIIERNQKMNRVLDSSKD